MTVLAVGVRVQGAVPAQPVPLQPVKVIPASGVADSVMVVPPGSGAETQVVPQAMPPVEEVTRPVPFPVLITVTVGDATGPLKVALSMSGLLIVSVQGPVPAQLPPIHPPNVCPVSGTAVRVMVVPVVNDPAQLCGVQTSPVGLEVMVPLPVPSMVTVRVL